MKHHLAIILLTVVFSTPIGAQDAAEEREYMREKAEIKKALGVDVDKLTPAEMGALIRGLEDGTPPEKALARVHNAEAIKDAVARVQREAAEKAEKAKAEELRSRGLEVNPRYDLIDPYGWR
jgi:hypothetical protein